MVKSFFNCGGELDNRGKNEKMHTREALPRVIKQWQLVLQLHHNRGFGSSGSFLLNGMIYIYLKAKTKAPTGERSGGKQHETNTMAFPIGRGTSFPTASPAPDICRSSTKVSGQFTSRIEAATTSTHQALLPITTERVGPVLKHPDRELGVQQSKYLSIQNTAAAGVISALLLLQIARTFHVEPALLNQVVVSTRSSEWK